MRDQPVVSAFIRVFQSLLAEGYLNFAEALRANYEEYEWYSEARKVLDDYFSEAKEELALIIQAMQTNLSGLNCHNDHLAIAKIEYDFEVYFFGFDERSDYFYRQGRNMTLFFELIKKEAPRGLGRAIKRYIKIFDFFNDDAYWLLEDIQGDMAIIFDILDARIAHKIYVLDFRPEDNPSLN